MQHLTCENEHQSHRATSTGCLSSNGIGALFNRPHTHDTQPAKGALSRACGGDLYLKGEGYED